MTTVIIQQPGLDLPTLIADVLVDSGAFDWLAKKISQAFRSIPKRAVEWFGSELHTPTNGVAPNVTFPGGELFNGVIFVEASVPSFWVLAKANAGKGQQRHYQPPFAGHDPYGPPNQHWPHEASGTRGLWPDVSPHEPPREGDPWNR